jgi:hypothetical protein
MRWSSSAVALTAGLIASDLQKAFALLSVAAQGTAAAAAAASYAACAADQ